MKIMYPAIFHAEEEDGFWVEFPDLPAVSFRSFFAGGIASADLTTQIALQRR